jgi:hypothetical protein
MATQCRALSRLACKGDVRADRFGCLPTADVHIRASDAMTPGLENERRTLIEEITAEVVRRLPASQCPAHVVADSDDGLVFVVCSFDPRMDPVFEAIAAAASAVGLRAVRVKDTQGDYRITDRILTLIRAARLVVADLSFELPNVYFELGYARGIGKTIVTIIRSGAAVHFDVRDWTYLEYIDSRPLERQLRERFVFEISDAGESSYSSTPEITRPLGMGENS